MDNNICFILCSCDSYEDLWVPFCTQLVKHWPEFDLPIYLSTETKSFRYDGLHIETPLKDSNTDLSSWSKRLVILLKNLPYDYLIFMLDDFLLTEDVDVKEVEKAYHIIKSDDKIGLIHLWPLISSNSNQRRRDNAVECQYPDFYLIKNKMPYRIMTQVSIWKKDYMLKVLRAHESAWHFEVRGTIRSRFLKEKVYAIKEKIMDYPEGGLIWRGKAVEERLNYYDQELIAGIINKRGVIKAGDSSAVTKRTPRNLSYLWNMLKSFSPKI